MQFLVRKIHHTTGEVFLDATRAKENEEFVLVEAESKEEAKEKVKNNESYSVVDAENKVQHKDDRALLDVIWIFIFITVLSFMHLINHIL